jgi:hypothetical protein
MLTMIMASKGQSLELRTQGNLMKYDDGLIIFLGLPQEFEVGGWPLLTAYTLKSEDGALVIYLPDFFTAGQTPKISEDCRIT